MERTQAPLHSRRHGQIRKISKFRLRRCGHLVRPARDRAAVYFSAGVLFFFAVLLLLLSLISGGWIVKIIDFFVAAGCGAMGGLLVLRKNCFRWAIGFSLVACITVMTYGVWFISLGYAENFVAGLFLFIFSILFVPVILLLWKEWKNLDGNLIG